MSWTAWTEIPRSASFLEEVMHLGNSPQFMNQVGEGPGGAGLALSSRARRSPAISTRTATGRGVGGRAGLEKTGQ